MSEQTIHGHRIIIVSERPDGRPPVAFVERMGRRPKRYTVIDADRRIRQLTQRMEVIQAVRAALTEVQT